MDPRIIEGALERQDDRLTTTVTGALVPARVIRAIPGTRIGRLKEQLAIAHDYKLRYSTRCFTYFAVWDWLVCRLSMCCCFRERCEQVR